MILVFLVSATSKTKIQFNGGEYASADEMPVSVRAAYDHAIGETPLLHSGARLAAKLNAKIIQNDTEFSNPRRNVGGRSAIVSRSACGRVPGKHCGIGQ